MLSFRVRGPLIERPVDVGSPVKKGDLLARIDPRDFDVALEEAQGRLERAQADFAELRAGAREETVRALEAKVRAAQAAFELAKTEEGRYRELLEKQVVSQSEYDANRLRMDLRQEELDAAREDLGRAQVARPEAIQAKEAEIRSLLAAVEQARNELDYTQLRAPYGGEISAMLFGFRRPTERVLKVGGYMQGGYGILLLLPTFGMHQPLAGTTLAVAVAAYLLGAAGIRRPQAYLAGAIATCATIVMLQLLPPRGLDLFYALFGVALPAVLLALLADVRLPAAPRPLEASEAPRA